MRTCQNACVSRWIAAASFVLLVTVLPEVASGFGLRPLRTVWPTPWASTACGGSGLSGSGGSSTCNGR